MRILKSILPLLGMVFVCAGVLVAHAPFADAAALFNSTYSANVASSTLNGIARQLRLDQTTTTNTLYVLGTSQVNLGKLSADGTSFSAVTYSSSLTAHTSSDMVVSNGQAYISITGAATPGLYQYSLSGNTANFVASTTLPSGSTAVSFNDDANTVYVSKGNVLYSFETDLTRVTPTTTLVQAPARLSYGGGKLFYIGSTGSIRRAILDGSSVLVNGVTDITLVTTGISSANIKGLVTSDDGSMLYYATTTSIVKRSATTGSVVWSIPVSGIAAMEVSASTGKIFVVNSAGVATVYNPINPVTSSLATASGTSVILNWTTGVSDLDFGGTTIVRSTSGYPASASDGTVVTSTSIATTFTEAGLSEGTYYYSFFNKTADGYYSTAVTSTATIDLPPAAPVLSADASGNSISLSWSVPATTASFVLRRSMIGFPATYTDGTAVTTTDSTVTSLIENGMPDGTYYYSIFAADGGGNYSSAGTASVTVDTTAPNAPSGFSATPNGGTINLSWSNPIDADFASSTIRRSTTGFPASITDGAAVTSTIATSYTDQPLADGTYYYSIFAIDVTGNISNRAMSSAVVNTQVSPSQSASSGGGGAGSVAVAPSGINATPLGFSIRSSGSNASGPVIVSSPAIQLQLHVNPATVRGYAASLDPLFVNAIILPLNASGEASFTLPNKAGTYTVYLKYFSTTGQISPVVSQTLIYAPVETASSIQPAQHASSSGAQGTNVAPIFTRVLRQGDRGADVKALQLFLNTHGFIVAKKGEGSRGHETTFFGPATVKALKKFQEAQKDAILKPYNLEKGSGVFGAKTMAYINAIR